MGRGDQRTQAFHFGKARFEPRRQRLCKFLVVHCVFSGERRNTPHSGPYFGPRLATPPFLMALVIVRKASVSDQNRKHSRPGYTKMPNWEQKNRNCPTCEHFFEQDVASSTNDDANCIRFLFAKYLSSNTYIAASTSIRTGRATARMGRSPFLSGAGGRPGAVRRRSVP